MEEMHQKNTAPKSDPIIYMYIFSSLVLKLLRVLTLTQHAYREGGFCSAEGPVPRLMELLF